jgi:hypothetical protein
MQADMNDKASETRELSDKLDSALADLEHSNRTKVCVCMCLCVCRPGSKSAPLRIYYVQSLNRVL